MAENEMAAMPEAVKGMGCHRHRGLTGMARWRKGSKGSASGKPVHASGAWGRREEISR